MKRRRQHEEAATTWKKMVISEFELKQIDQLREQLDAEFKQKHHKSYVGWCDENGFHAINNKQFSGKLKERGIQKAPRIGRGNRYKGISVGNVSSVAISDNFTYAREAIGKNTQMYSLPTLPTPEYAKDKSLAPSLESSLEPEWVDI